MPDAPSPPPSSFPSLAPSPTTPVRYIKLGRGGTWTARSLQGQEIPLGHPLVPHDLATADDRDALTAFYVDQGKSPGIAKSYAREVHDFHHLGPDALWITFADGHLWWAHAAPEVTWHGTEVADPSRSRRTLGPWRNRDASGRTLAMDTLSTKLTKVAMYRQTLCGLEPEVEAYLLRKLAGEEEPAVTAALEARRALVASAEALIAGLHWADFETLVDLILARGGWHRVSALGGTMKDADLVVEQAVTQERALVQVKSAASQPVLDDYVERYEASGMFHRLIFVCHSPSGPLAAAERSDVTVWARASLAETAVRHGLTEWLVARAG